jgi:polynucleotide kinase-phosphatase
MTTRIRIPDLSLVVLIGASGSGKSSWAAKHFAPTQVVSSDFCRGLVADDETDQTATTAAFEVLHTIVEKRLEAGRLTVVDATNVRPEDRRPLVQLARRQHVLPIAIVLDVPPEVCHERNASRPDRDFGPHVVRNQRAALRRSLNGLGREGFRRVSILRGRDIDDAVIELEPRWTDKRALTGPFDIVGDVHGCHDELVGLLRTLGWEVDETGEHARHPAGRTVVFLGDLVDRGPAIPATLRLAMNMVRDDVALCIPGNHENKLARALNGRNVTVSHGLAQSLEQLEQESPEFRADVVKFIEGLVSHLVLDGGDLVVSHAGLPESMHNRASSAVRAFNLYGDTTGETDDYGLPVRYPWADDYRGRATVVYGHTPVPRAQWVNNTICVDTGCVFGGQLSALRWPERELVAVDAAREYYEPSRPLVETSVDTREPGELDLGDVLGKRIVTTRLTGTITIREENSAAALEVMSRFAIEPRWLVYLPPTMAPSATTERDGLLEHPAEAFADFRRDGVRHVVCEEKHMGSRAVVVLGRDEGVAAERFGVADGRAGALYTRTGRAFFPTGTFEDELLGRVRAAVERAELWDELETDWLLLDCELLPWSVKAEELLRRQYASVGAAASRALDAEAEVYAQLATRVDGADELAAQAVARAANAAQFVDAYRRYCWSVTSLDDLSLAPFQVLATEGRVRALEPHPWHLDVLGRLADADPAVLQATRALEVDLDDPAAEAVAIEWWETMTAAGGEGMVVKPRDVVLETTRGITQPGIKCRGREYLRIIYGPEYTAPKALERLRQRGLGHKRSLALREFSLGIEALERFVAREPLYRVHECVFGVLALESEPVDPRL